MSVTIRSFKNYRKIAKEVKKIFKQQLQSKPNSIIGMEWKDDFLKVTNNLKKIVKLDWFSAYLFPLATYVDLQKNPLDKELIENFVQKINIPVSHYEDIHKLAIKYYSENRPNDLFLFDVQGGVDLLVFFIDSRGNFIFNDYESKKTYLNKANNGSDLISIGIKSILNAKKIICFCIEEASKDVIFKLNRKVVDVDDTLTYLHLHNDITLFTLNSIINKHEINNEPMTQDRFQFIKELDNIDDSIDLPFIKEQVDKESNVEQEEEHVNIENINLEDFNKNMDNLDEPLLEILQDDENELADNSELFENEPLDEEFESKEFEDQIEEDIFNINETANILKEQVYETGSTIENVENIIDNLEQSVEEIDEYNNNYFDDQVNTSTLETEDDNNSLYKEDHISYLDQEEEYKSDFVYLEPNYFDFIKTTKNADERNKEDLMKKINDLKNELLRIEKEKELILLKAKEEELKFKKDLEEKEKQKVLNEVNYDLEEKDEFTDLDKFVDESSEILKIDSSINIEQDLDLVDINKELENDLEELNISETFDENKDIEELNASETSNDNKDIEELNTSKTSNDNKEDESINALIDQTEEKIKDSITPIGSDIPNTTDDIYRYLKIKSETLNHIEKLLLNNKLGKMKTDLIQKHNESHVSYIDKKIANHTAVKFINDNRHIIDKTNNDIEKYKLKYISGFRPVPMLMVWHDINKNFYLDLVKEMKQNFSLTFTTDVFDEQGIHVWNDGCYLIYDESSLMIRALAFESIDRLIFLLRYVNKNLSMLIPSKEASNILSNLFLGKESEIKVERF